MVIGHFLKSKMTRAGELVRQIDADLASPAGRARARLHYRDAVDIPLVVLALCTIPLLLAEFFLDPAGTSSEWIEATYAIIWGLFLLDFPMDPHTCGVSGSPSS
jgi:hypothetical protein